MESISCIRSKVSLTERRSGGVGGREGYNLSQKQGKIRGKGSGGLAYLILEKAR